MNLKDKKVDLKFCALGPFLVQTKIEQEFIDLLLEKGDECRKKNLDYAYNSKHQFQLAPWKVPLAGMVREAHYYDNKEYAKWFLPKISPYIDEYIKEVSDYSSAPAFRGPKQMLDMDFVDIPSLWVNYQKGSEYLPPHNHDGDLSFVIYLQVPDEIKKESEEVIGSGSFPGHINFDYGVQLPFSNNCFRHLPEVGDLFIFPAWLKHHVYSFKADVERISVSGDIFFKPINITSWSNAK